MRAQLLHRCGELLAAALGAEFRIGQVAAVAIRVTEMHARTWCMVELVRRHTVAQHVAPVVGEPELARLRLPVEADRVAHAACEGFDGAAIRVHAQDVGVALRIGFTDVAGCADRHIQLAVRPEGDEFPAVVGLARQPVGDQCGWGRVVEPALDVVEAQDAADRRHVQAAVAVGHSHRHLQVAGHHDRCLRPVGRIEAQRMHATGTHRPDEQRAAIGVGAPQGHLARVVHARPQRDRETGRQLDLLQRKGSLRHGTGTRQGQQAAPQQQHGTHPAIPPVQPIGVAAVEGV